MNSSTKIVCVFFAILAVTAMVWVVGCRAGGGASKVKAPLGKVLPDRDRDGIPDNSDLCPDKMEDWDGDRDHDGCPEVDPPADCFDEKGRRCPHGSLLRRDPAREMPWG